MKLFLYALSTFGLVLLFTNPASSADLTNNTLVQLQDFGRMARFDKSTGAPANKTTPENHLALQIVEQTSELASARPGDAFGITWRVSRAGDYTLVLIDPMGEKIIEERYQPKITYQQAIQICDGTWSGLHAFEIRHQGEVKLRKEFTITLAK